MYHPLHLDQLRVQREMAIARRPRPEDAPKSARRSWRNRREAR